MWVSFFLSLSLFRIDANLLLKQTQQGAARLVEGTLRERPRNVWKLRPRREHEEWEVGGGHAQTGVRDKGRERKRGSQSSRKEKMRRKGEEVREEEEEERASDRHGGMETDKARDTRTRAQKHTGMNRSTETQRQRQRDTDTTNTDAPTEEAKQEKEGEHVHRKRDEQTGRYSARWKQRVKRTREGRRRTCLITSSTPLHLPSIFQLPVPPRIFVLLSLPLHIVTFTFSSHLYLSRLQTSSFCVFVSVLALCRFCSV